MGSATIGFGAMAPQILEKINEYLKFTIFNNFDALPPAPNLNPWWTPCPMLAYTTRETQCEFGYPCRNLHSLLFLSAQRMSANRFLGS